MESPESQNLDLSFLPEGFSLVYAGRSVSQNLTVIIAAPFYEEPHLSKYQNIYKSKVFFLREDGTREEQQVKSATLFRDGGTRTFALGNGSRIVMPKLGGTRTLNGEALETVQE